MSPARAKKTPKAKTNTGNTLTIDFSGISTLVWNREKGTAEVRLVDLGAAGYQQHYAAMGVVVDEDFPKSLKGPDADAAISLPGADRDLGLWNLAGTDVEFLGVDGKLSVEDRKIDPAVRPGRTAESIQWLANIGFLTASTTLDRVCPISSIISLPAGRVTANATAGVRKVRFADHGAPVGPPRFCVSRFKVVMPFADEMAIRLDRRRIFRLHQSMSIMISNTCVCGLGQQGMPNHFYAHYDVTNAERRPTVEPSGPRPMTPMEPEFCFAAFVAE